MASQLAPEEPDAGPWRAEPLTRVIEILTQSPMSMAAGDHPVVLAIDGRSSSGKTRLADRIHQAVPGSAVVHTDDIAWCHSRFGWADLLVDGVLLPARHGSAVTFQPPRWAEHGRTGTINVPAHCPLLIIEGAGAGRREAADLTDALIWVQSDQRETSRRSLARVGQPGGPASVDSLRAWMAEEDPFLADQRPWERASLIAAGTPSISFDATTELVVSALVHHRRDRNGAPSPQAARRGQPRDRTG